MSEKDSIVEILQGYPGLDNASFEEELKKTLVFGGDRKGKKVTVQIIDNGPECCTPGYRFTCKVKQEDGKTTTGNGGESAEEAVESVGMHWKDLD